MSDIKVALPTVITNKDLSDGRAVIVTADNALLVSPIDSSSGAVCQHGTYAAVNTGSTQTITTYTVGSGDTLMLKSVAVSASAGPCKVIVDVTDGSGTLIETLFTAFFSSADPTLQLVVPAGIDVAATNIVRVRVKNNAVASQDVFATITGKII
jgi:hypothetical protein